MCIVSVTNLPCESTSYVGLPCSSYTTSSVPPLTIVFLLALVNVKHQLGLVPII